MDDRREATNHGRDYRIQPRIVLLQARAAFGLDKGQGFHVIACAVQGIALTIRGHLGRSQFISPVGPFTAPDVTVVRFVWRKSFNGRETKQDVNQNQEPERGW
jgi:hypothetical protein